MKVGNTRSGLDGTRPRSVLQARAALAALVAAVVVGSAMAALFFRPTTYDSTATVLVNPVLVPGVTPLPVDMATEKAIVASAAVLTRASADLGLPLNTVADSLSVDVPVDTRILKITADAVTASEARRRAGAIARAYVTYRVETYSAADPKPRRGSPQPQAAAATLVTPPSSPRGPARPDPIVVLVAALVVGLVLGVATALLRDHLDDTIRDAADLQATSGLRVLAVVPNRRTRGSEAGTGPPVHDEAFNLLRMRILSLFGDAPPLVLLVTSTTPALARSVADNLAAAMAEERPDVVLLTTPGEAKPAVGDSGANGVDSIPLDLADPRPLLESVTQRSSFVIIEAPPLWAGAGTRRVAALADAILLVEQRGASTRVQVRAARDFAHDVPGEVIGAVLVEPSRSRSARNLRLGLAQWAGSWRAQDAPAANDPRVRP